MSKRFDYRDEQTFKKDIYFGTQIEKFFFNAWVSQPQNENFTIIDYDNNGVCNEGTFIKSGKTSGADYKVTFNYQGKEYKDELLEVKWVPTKGKFSLKSGDLKAYLREGASILFIYNTESPALRKPRDYNLNAHIAKIYKHKNQIKWGILFNDQLEILMGHYKEEPIYYMGNKPGYIIPSQDFHTWFKEEDFLWKQ